MSGTSGDGGPPIDPAIGLCSACRHGRTQTSARGSTFWRCARAESDPSFPRYPPVPVLECRGHERGAPDGSR